jgi:CHAT domain-containing protein
MDVPKSLDCTLVDEQDLVSRYIGRKLSPEEAETFEEHYFGCERCWGEVKTGAEVRAAVPDERATVPASHGTVVKGPWRTIALLAVAAAVAIAAAGILVRSRRSPTEELIRASSQLESRSLLTRLSGPFPYRPLRKVLRGPGAEELPLDHRRAALEAQKRAEDRPSAETLHAAGVAHLLLGEQEPAIARLQEALKLSPDDPSLMSDLAAAFFARSRRLEELQERDKALGDVNEAMRLIRGALSKDASQPQAIFNRALILESQHFRREAADAWRRYLDVDSTSGWASEARAHLADLTRETDSFLWERHRNEIEKAATSGQRGSIDRLLTDLSQPARVYVEDEILPAWGRAFGTDPQGAQRFLEISREIGSALVRGPGDDLVRDAVAEIDSRTASGQNDSCRRLAEAYRLYGEGRALFKARKIEKAIRILDRARELLSRESGAFAAQVRIVLASSRFYQSDFEACERLLDEIESQLGADAVRYGSVVAQMNWLRGLVQISRGHAEESLRSYRLVLAEFERLKETENTAAAHTLLAENLQYLGAMDEALGHRERALVLLNELGNPPRLHTTLREIATGAYTRGRYEIAREALERLVTLSVEQGSPVFMADALLLLGMTQEKTGDFEAALSTAARARAFCARIDEEGVRDRSEADLDSAEALMWARTDPAKALGMLSSAVDYFVRVGNHSRLAQVYLERGLLRAATGDKAAAEADFLAGTEELEAERGRINDDQFRLSYFESGKDLFDELIGLAADRADARGSLTYAEKSKARVLLDRSGTWGADSSGGAAPVTRPLDAGAIASRVPPDTALIEYRVLSDRLLAWVVKRQGVEMTGTMVGREELNGLVDNLQRTMRSESDPKEADLFAVKLYDRLIRPLQSQLDGIRTLIVVPDKSLNAVPFAGLRDSIGGRYLIEGYTLATAPSATLFLESLARSRAAKGPPRSVLVVSNPSFDKDGFPDLPSLTFAAKETELIRASYEVVEVQQDLYATKSHFLERAPRFEIVHFAGHALVNEENPSLSLLLFAPDPARGDSGCLYAHEIEKAGFDRTRLVILGACSTSRGAVHDIEGVASLARSFLKAGSPAVLATLWEVGDEAAARLLARFHEGLSEGQDGASALRSAQRSMMSGTPRGTGGLGWAAFALTGWVEARRLDSHGT